MIDDWQFEFSEDVQEAEYQSGGFKLLTSSSQEEKRT
jgi:hypothetical protein